MFAVSTSGADCMCRISVEVCAGSRNTCISKKPWPDNCQDTRAGYAEVCKIRAVVPARTSGFALFRAGATPDVARAITTSVPLGGLPLRVQAVPRRGANGDLRPAATTRVLTPPPRAQLEPIYPRTRSRRLRL
jgi:hypothetical protein